MTNKDKEDNNSSEEPKKGTLQIKLAELPVQTAELEIAGLKWKLRWDKGENHCEITCNQGCVDRLWLCRAKCTFTAKDRTWVEWPDPSSNYWFNSKNLQTFGLHYSGGRHLKATAVKVHIEILWAAHETCFPPLDDILDVKYGKQSKTFHVNRHALAMHSPTYFSNFFFGDWAEKRKKHGEGYSIEEKADLDLEAFANMLYYVHLWAPLVEKQGFLERDEPYYLLNILELAIKYTFPMLVHYVEKQLIKRGAGTMEQLVVAESQNLPTLKKHCLETIDVLEYSKNFMENTELLTRLGKETRQLLDKRFKQTAERYSRKRKLLEEEDSDEEEEEDDNDENSEEGEEDASIDDSVDVDDDDDDEEEEEEDEEEDI